VSDNITNINKEEYLQSLSTLISQIDNLEKEYKTNLKAYEDLQNVIKTMVEILPNAVWILFEDNKQIFLENSEAKKLNYLIEKFDLNNIDKQSDFEVSDNNRFYLIKVKKELQKIVIVATDITEQRRKERLVSMGQMAAHLAHEIRNPIGAVSILTSTLMEKVDTKVKKDIFDIKKSVWRVERIVKATLLFTKGLQIGPIIFSLKDLIIDIEDAIAYYSYEKDIEFDFDLPEKSIVADKELLSLVFQNLIFNSIDAIEEQDDTETGKITVTCIDTDDYHIFKITDTGTPIENPSILFEAYKTTKTKGNGLGLVLSMQIVKAHEGDIKFIENEKGFEFSIKKVKI
jgi:two-component system NtrC family sensor kinase/two-component system sensor histidine kinase AtoS